MRAIYPGAAILACLQEPTEDNRVYWSSAPVELCRLALFTSYLHHPDPKVRLGTLDPNLKYVYRAIEKCCIDHLCISANIDIILVILYGDLRLFEVVSEGLNIH